LELIETTPSDNNERAILVGVLFSGGSRWVVEDHLNELEQLTRSAGAEVVSTELVKRSAPSAPTYIGKGKLEELKFICLDEDATTVIFDDDLSPAQQRNVEKIIDKKIIDRTELILDIFAQRANTSEAQLQIELAQLQYMLPRLTRQWTHLSKQLGGIGTRGPGETQLEVDRRRVRERIHSLGHQIKQVRKHRTTQRKSRNRHGYKTAALVGYTNAGKSTLLNALTGSHVLIEDKLFATLDPMTRKLVLPNNLKLLISDTVGFIRKLPHHLIDSFRATFEESALADILIHVIDISHPQAAEQSDAVYEVLDELGIHDKHVITVLNKTDSITSPAVIERYSNSHPNCVPVSALKKTGLDQLMEKFQETFADSLQLVDLKIPQSQSQLIHKIYRDGNVISRRYEDNDVLIEAEIPPKLIAKTAQYLTAPKPMMKQ
jgi:GTPase